MLVVNIGLKVLPRYYGFVESPGEAQVHVARAHSPYPLDAVDLRHVLAPRDRRSCLRLHASLGSTTKARSVVECDYVTGAMHARKVFDDALTLWKGSPFWGFTGVAAATSTYC